MCLSKNERKSLIQMITWMLIMKTMILACSQRIERLSLLLRYCIQIIFIIYANLRSVHSLFVKDLVVHQKRIGSQELTLFLIIRPTRQPLSFFSPSHLLLQRPTRRIPALISILHVLLKQSNSVCRNQYGKFQL